MIARIVLVLTIGVTPAAIGATPEERSITAAATYWQTWPPCGHPRTEVRTAETMGAAAGFADAAACVIVVNDAPRPADLRTYVDAWRWTRVCDTVVHEVGHLLGYAHDGPAIMRHRRLAVAQPCLDEFLPPPAWARVTTGIRRLYQYGELDDARAAYLRWKRRSRRR